MLPDHDLEKWEYAEHTKAKHQLLERYIKAWMPILGQALRRFGRESRVVLVDAFAGRGRYREGEPGSPLILRDIARQVSEAGKVDAVELHFIERSRQNYQTLMAELQADDQTGQVVQHDPIYSTFEAAAPPIISSLRSRPRPSFWFIDPFGFGDIPLSVIRDILSLQQPLARSEIFITLMVRDMNRFLNGPNHRQAIMELLELQPVELDEAITAIERSERRADELHALYVRRLKNYAGAKYTWSHRMASRGTGDTVYYLVHGSNHPKALREIKEASYMMSGGTYAFLGTTDPSVTGQSSFQDHEPSIFIDFQRLKRHLLQRFSGRDIECDDLQDEAHPEPALDDFIDDHVRQALEQLISEGLVSVVRVGGRSRRRLAYLLDPAG